MIEQKSLRRRIAEKIEKEHLIDDDGKSLFEGTPKDLDFFAALERDLILATADAIIKMVKRDLEKSNSLATYLTKISNNYHNANL